MSIPDLHIQHLLAPAYRNDDPRLTAQTASEWLSRGILQQDAVPALYVCRTTDSTGVRLSVVSLIDLSTDVLRPHEEVIASYAIRQARLAEATHAQWEPITACTTETRVSPLLEKHIGGEPLVRTEDNGRSDELWAVTDSQGIDDLSRVLAEQTLVIADGHHRYAAWRAAPERAGQCAVTMTFDPDGIDVGPIHRVVPELTLDSALAGIPLATSTLDGTAAAESWLEGSENRCVLTDGERFLGVDAYVCASSWAEQVFTPHHGLESEAVRYEPDLSSAVTEASRVGGTALLLATPRMATISRAATTGRLLPHKSSWFSPKPRVGLLVHRWA